MQKENDTKPRYTVIVPVFNSAETLEELIGRIEDVMSSHGPYELLMVDDFSTDNSWEELIRIKAGRSHIKLLKFTRNFGQAAATLCGIREAKADIMIIIDDDLQYPPEEIPKLIAAFDPEDQYLIFGVPEEKKNSVFQRMTSSLVEGFINKVVFQSKKRIRFSTFRILTKKRYKQTEYNEKQMRSAQIFFTMVSPALMDYIPVKHQPRKKGRSGYSFLKRLRIALELVLVTTEMPWYLFILLTFAFLILAGVFIAISPFVKEFSIPGTILAAIVASGFTATMFGFVLVFGYIKKMMLGYLGAESYAIWKEA